MRLAASPIKVKKGAKTKLTAIVNRGKDCADRKVLFQEKTDRSWDNLGRAVKPGKGCKVSKKVKITAKSVFEGGPDQLEESGDARVLAQGHRQAEVAPSLRVMRPPRRSFLPRREYSQAKTPGASLPGRVGSRQWIG